MTLCYIGLGSNQGSPVDHVRRALVELDHIPVSRLIRHSSLYQSRPHGPQGQPDFINAVAAVETELEPEGLLGNLQGIEALHGRQRSGQRWGPRTLDLDVLLFGDLELKVAGLTIPHPGIIDRNFVLLPLLELDRDIVIPGNGAAREVLARLEPGGLVRLPAYG